MSLARRIGVAVASRAFKRLVNRVTRDAQIRAEAREEGYRAGWDAHRLGFPHEYEERED